MSVKYIPNIFVSIVVFLIMLVATPALADHLPVMYVQVPQWTDDWAVCAVDIPDAACHWYVIAPDKTSSVSLGSTPKAPGIMKGIEVCGNIPVGSIGCVVGETGVTDLRLNSSISACVTGISPDAKTGSPI